MKYEILVPIKVRKAGSNAIPEPYMAELRVEAESDCEAIMFFQERLSVALSALKTREKPQNRDYFNE